MATILDELIDELSAKEKRIAKEVINIDRSSVIPDHYKKQKQYYKWQMKELKLEKEQDICSD